MRGARPRRAAEAVARPAASGARATPDVSAETPPRVMAQVRRLSAEGRTQPPGPSAVPSRAPARTLLVALVAALLLAAPLGAQSRITTTVDSTHATVGDRITLSVTVEHAPGAQVAWPDSLDLAPFEVLAAQVAPPAAADGVVRSSATYTLAAFELGELEIPSFDVQVVGPDGETETLSTDAWVVEVLSVGVDESGEIRDIRGPLAIPLSLLRMLLLALAPLLLVALLYTLARRLRSRDEAAQPGRPALERPAHEIALEALAVLEASGMLERGEVKEYHIEVSDVLRTYVERRFRVDALEMTTREVLLGLERVGVDESFREGLAAFLDQCDMVKFARVRPGPEPSRQVLELGRRIVQRSVPRADAESPSGAASTDVDADAVGTAAGVAREAP